MNIFAGIDIGQKGGIAAIGEDFNIVLLEDFPQKNIIETMHFHFWDILARELEEDDIYLVKESPIKKLSPTIGGTYSRGISIGENIGIWKYWLEINQIKWKDCPAITWQKIFPEFILPGGKERSAAAAMREIPGCEKIIYGPRGGLRDGRSDAILLSIFCKLLVDRGMFR